MRQDESSDHLPADDILDMLQVELQQGYDLSPAAALGLSRRLQQLVNEQLGCDRRPGQIRYQASAIDEPPGRAVRDCRKVPVHLTIVAPEDARILATAGAEALRLRRVHRLVYEALLQGGDLSQDEIACFLGISAKTVQRIYSRHREQKRPLPGRGDFQGTGPEDENKILVIRHYLQHLSLAQEPDGDDPGSLHSVKAHLQHFGLVMLLEERGLAPAQMAGTIGIPSGLVEHYRMLYYELNVPEYRPALRRVQDALFPDNPADRPNSP